jgi:hypothetical protein
MKMTDEKPILTRCGYRCDLCLAYKPNVEENPTNRQILSDGWFKYFGFRIPPEEICCDGCMADQPILIDKACPVRPCVMEKNISNCAHCTNYVCEKLKERLVTFEEVQTRTSFVIPVEDRDRFIKPYENHKRLKDLHSEK